ncbi:hypothetical protein Q5530_10375 [Saccharothrix sp. BKS2]|uniref:hypothetical protein n=1 Tax=Saccharothrix sp. BKS2 TaxID=3064400 RepID=UPI0039E84C69
MRIRKFLDTVVAALLVTGLASATASYYSSGAQSGYPTSTCHIYRTNHPWFVHGSANFTPVGDV